MDKLLEMFSDKLGDPSITEGNGVIFSKKLKERYLQTAFANLVSLIDRISPMDRPLFTELDAIYQLEKINFPPKNNIELPNAIKIKEIYAVINGKGYSVRKTDLNEWLSIMFENNSYHKYTTENPIYYLEGNIISILPEINKTYDTIIITYKRKTALKDDNVNAIELISDDYIDLMLALACVEAFTDNQDFNKVQAYQNYINWKLQTLGQYSAKQERKEK